MFKFLNKNKENKNEKEENKKSFLKEFQTFAMKGNVLDLAVGVVMGTAFSGIVNSLVNDIIMPLVSIATGSVDFSNLKFIKEYKIDGNVKEFIMPYGKFIQAIINFIIISFSIFIFVKIINIAKEKFLNEETKKAETSKDIVLLEEIRDILKSQSESKRD